METLEKLTIFLKVISVVILTGCCTSNSDMRVITQFPPRAKVVEYSTKPVIEYNKSNKTYIVTSEFMHHAVNNEILIVEILKWKRDNGIR